MRRAPPTTLVFALACAWIGVASASCAVESDGLTWCVASTSVSGLALSYAVAGSSSLDVRVRAVFSGAHDPQGAGWVAFGPGSSMANAEIALALGSSSPTLYRLSGRSTPSTPCGSGCSVSAANVTSTATSRTLVVRYADANASAGATKSFIFASSTDAAMTGHSNSRRGTVSLDFSTGNAVTTTKSTVKRDVAHGVLMLLAWGVFMPLGAGMTQMKNLLPDGKWFVGHSGLVAVGSVIFIVAIAMLKDGHDDVQGTHDLYDGHRGVGIAVMAMWLFQVLLGTFRPNKNIRDGDRFGIIPAEWRDNWFFAHAVMGQLTIGLATVVMVIGAVMVKDKYTDPTDSGIKFLANGGVYGVFVGVWALCAFGAWRDGFAKSKLGSEAYGIRQPTPEESAANAAAVRFTGISVEGASKKSKKKDHDSDSDWSDSD